MRIMSRFVLWCWPVLLSLLVPTGFAFAGEQTIYDSLYSPQPTNVASLPYQAQQNSEVGDEISFAGSYRTLSDVTLTLSDWATYSTYASDSSYKSSGWSLPLTLTLYNVGSNNTLGSVISSLTIDPTILWRPEPDGCGGDPTAFTGADGSCDHGLAQNVQFNFSGVTVPDKVIYGLSFNTQTYGANPIGVAGPYNSLNFGLNYVCTGSCATSYGYWDSPSIGTHLSGLGSLWLDNAGAYVNGGTRNVFSQNYYDQYYYVPAIQFNAVPEPSSALLLAPGLVGIGALMRRRRAATAKR